MLQRSRKAGPGAGPWRLIALGVTTVVLAGLAVSRWAPISPVVSGTSSSPSHAAATVSPPENRPAAPGLTSGQIPSGAPSLNAERRGLGQADGILPAHTTVFDAEIPGIANLDPDLRSALREATTDAAGDGVKLYVDSGWRSAAYQERLLRQAIATYGSEEQAARWVATPETSPHVSGDAVDIGPAGAAAWLATHGSDYGLCQIYRNEPWHFELRPDAVGHGCPPRYADPAHDPRMQ